MHEQAEVLSALRQPLSGPEIHPHSCCRWFQWQSALACLWPTECWFLSHRQDQKRHREGRRNPPAPRKINQFRIGRVIERRLFGFQCHPANRTGSRPLLTDFRVHRACPHRTECGNEFRTRSIGEIFGGVRREFCQTSSTAKMKMRAVMRGVMACFCWIDYHPANWISHYGRRF